MYHAYLKRDQYLRESEDIKNQRVLSGESQAQSMQEFVPRGENVIRAQGQSHSNSKHHEMKMNDYTNKSELPEDEDALGESYDYMDDLNNFKGQKGHGRPQTAIHMRPQSGTSNRPTSGLRPHSNMSSKPEQDN